VENIKAEGPTVYAHEVFVLNRASPDMTYTVTRNFFYLQPDCSGDGAVFMDEVAVLRTNAAGNARGDLLVRPADVAGAEGVSGVFWSVADETGTVVYQTACTVVTLDRNRLHRGGRAAANRVRHRLGRRCVPAGTLIVRG
jgi:hypothetical protein